MLQEGGEMTLLHSCSEDLRLKQLSKRNAVLQEIIQTEKSYVGKLTVLYDEYLHPLSQVTEEADSLQIEGNVRSIKGFHEVFVEKLTKAMEIENGIFKSLRYSTSMEIFSRCTHLTLNRTRRRSN